MRGTIIIVNTVLTIIIVSWEDVSGHFSSPQWKGGGIDGGVIPPWWATGSSDDVSHILFGTHHGRWSE